MKTGRTCKNKDAAACRPSFPELLAKVSFKLALIYFWWKEKTWQGLWMLSPVSLFIVRSLSWHVIEKCFLCSLVFVFFIAFCFHKMNIIAVTAIQSPISERHSCWWHARCSHWPRNKNIQNSASRNQSVRTPSSWEQNVNKQAVAKVVIFCPQSEKCTLHIMRFPSVHLNSTYSHFPNQYPN